MSSRLIIALIIMLLAPGVQAHNLIFKLATSVIKIHSGATQSGVVQSINKRWKIGIAHR